MKHIVIPARFSSTRLPGKPLLEIHGRPMILRVVDQAKKVEGFDDLCVATDDERIAEVCRAEQIDVVITNPAHPSGTDRLSEVARIKGGAKTILLSMFKATSRSYLQHWCNRSHHCWWLSQIARCRLYVSRFIL